MITIIWRQKSHNLESTAIKSRNWSAVAAISHPRAGRRALPSSGRNCMPPLPFGLAGHSPTGISQIRRGDQQHWEATWAHHLQGPHERVVKRVAKNIEKATRTTSFIGSCSYSPCCRRHLARILSTGIAAIGTKQQLPAPPPHAQGWRRKQICLWCFPLPVAGTWWWKQPPLLMLMTMMMGAMPRAADSAAKGEAKLDDFQLEYGWVRPGTMESHSWSVGRPLWIKPSINSGLNQV